MDTKKPATHKGRLSFGIIEFGWTPTQVNMLKNYGLYSTVIFWFGLFLPVFYLNAFLNILPTCDHGFDMSR